MHTLSPVPCAARAARTPTVAGGTGETRRRSSSPPTPPKGPPRPAWLARHAQRRALQRARPPRRPGTRDKAPHARGRSARRLRRVGLAPDSEPRAQTASRRPSGRPSGGRAAEIGELGARCRRRENPALIFEGQTAGRRARAQTHFASYSRWFPYHLEPLNRAEHRVVRRVCRPIAPPSGRPPATRRAPGQRARGEPTIARPARWPRSKSRKLGLRARCFRPSRPAASLHGSRLASLPRLTTASITIA